MSDLIKRSDAIEAVVCHIWHLPNEVYKQFNCENIVREVVEDAIERLPSAEAVTHGRLINADALMDLLKKRKQFFVDSYGGSFHYMSEKDQARCDEINACIASIVNAPTESAETVQSGEWIETISGNGWNEWSVLKCSLCGATIEDKQNRLWEYNFCPSCGAAMKQNL